MMELRWQHYSYYRDTNCLDFWEKHFTKDRNVLFILGVGFDPRMTQVIEEFNDKINQNISCLQINIKGDKTIGASSNHSKDLISQNKEKIKSLLVKEKISSKNIQLRSAGQQRIISRKIADIISVKDLRNFTDVILDISSMSRGVYGPLLASLLQLFDRNKILANKCLHIVGTENPRLDQLIKSKGLDEQPTYLHLLQRNMHLQSLDNLPKIWLPILGENRKNSFQKIYNFFDPNEICPILPFPSSNPRRSDKILIEYLELFLEYGIFGSRNIIYTSEYNPFDTYRKIIGVVMNYIESFKPLGGAKFMISSLSSKTLTLGAVLATYELISKLPTISRIPGQTDIPVAVGMSHIFPDPYDITELKSESIRTILDDSVFFSSLLYYPEIDDCDTSILARTG